MRFPVFLFAIVSAGALFCQSRGISEESKVPPYTLPDPLIDSQGKQVRTARQWEGRRKEIFHLFETEMYGRVPPKPDGLRSELVERSDQALGGKAIRKQYVVTLGKDPKAPKMDLLLYLPKQVKGRAPVFFGMNFPGNQAVNADPAIRITQSWVSKDNKKERGVAASRWPIEQVLARGYGVATVYVGDLDPDYDDGFQNGVHAVYGKPKPDEWGTLAAWAWGYGRAMDVLEKDPNVDAKRVIIHGHSRIGKAALWAGALDPRFAIVISNDSGAGGAALSKRIFGETVKDLNDHFPHWFCANFRKYSANEAALPMDQHMLLALIAPRPLYVDSAAEDLWSDPKGEFLSALGADPVYRLLTGEGLPVKEWPPVGQPVMGRIGYHVRPGKHDVTLYDWERWMDFADKWLR